MWSLPAALLSKKAVEDENWHLVLETINDSIGLGRIGSRDNFSSADKASVR